jgi:HK97 gp10 family phage protein
MADFTLLGFATHLAGVIAAEEKHNAATLEAAAQIVEHKIKGVIGTYELGWEPLADSTLKKKNADTPLLESGELQRSIQHTSDHKEAHIGTNDEHAIFHELGTRTEPPRSFMLGGAKAVEHKVIEILGKGAIRHLEGKDVTARGLLGS